MAASIFKRTGFTFFATGMRALVLLSTSVYLSQTLGPSACGKLAFLIASFIALKAFLDLGTSSAFYTFLSQKEQDLESLCYYGLWLIVQFLVPLLTIFVIFPDHWLTFIWPDSEIPVILIAYLAIFAQNGLWITVTQIGDAQRQTYLIQSVSLLLSILYIGLIFLLDIFNSLSIMAVLICLAFEHTLLSILVFRRLASNIQGSRALNLMGAHSYFLRIFKYCLPLIPYTIISASAEFGDRWLLQYYGGSEEQAYYAIAWQISAVSLLATTSFIRIFWKEISDAFASKDFNRMELLFNTSLKSLYLITAVVISALVYWVDEIVLVLLGEEYIKGAMVLSLLLFFPLHQCLGQMLSSFLYATEQPGLLAVSGSITLLLGLLLTYLLLAPSQALVGGFDLGAEGLASKMLIIQFLNVNIVAYLATKKMKWGFDFSYQVSTLLLCLGAGGLGQYAVSWLLMTFEWPLMLVIFVYGLVYLFIITAVVIYLPKVVGLTKKDVDRVFSRLRPIGG